MFDEERKPQFQCQNLFFAVMAGGEGAVTMRYVFEQRAVNNLQKDSQEASNTEKAIVVPKRNKRASSLPTDNAHDPRLVQEISISLNFAFS